MGRQKNGTGSFVTRKDGTVEYKVSIGIGMDGKSLRKSFYGKDKKAAIQKYKEWLKSSGEVPIEKVTTVGEWADNWLLIYKKDKVAYGTYDNYKQYVNNYIKPILGHLKFEQVRPAHIEMFFNKISGLSKSAKKHIHIALRGIFNSAIENHFCKESPVKPFKKYITSAEEDEKKVKEEVKVFSPTQIKQILEIAPTHKYGHYVLILLYTGLRVGELLALQWTDIKDDLITVRRSQARAEGGGYIDKAPKSGKVRYVGITPDLQKILDNLPKKGIYVLTDEKGQQITLSGFEKRYKKFFTDTGIEFLSPHKCRHTYATYLLKGGVDIKIVQSLLGHSTVNVTEIYTHVNTDDIKNNVKKLNY